MANQKEKTEALSRALINYIDSLEQDSPQTIEEIEKELETIMKSL